MAASIPASRSAAVLTQAPCPSRLGKKAGLLPVTVSRASRRGRPPGNASIGRPAELRVVDRLLGAVMAAGFEGLEAAVVYRALGDFTLGFCGAEAALLALPEPLQTADRAAWSQSYRAVDSEEYPHIWRVRDELPLVAEDEIFEAIRRP